MDCLPKGIWPWSVLLCLIVPFTGQANSQFEQALIARDEGKPYLSNQLLSQVQGVDSRRLALEKASNYFQMRDYQQARQSLSTVISDRTVPVTVRRKAVSFLRKVNHAAQQERQHRHHLSGRIQLGIGGDSNPAVASTQDVIDDFDTRGALSADQNPRPENDLYGNLNLRVNYIYTAPGSWDLGGSPVLRRWRNSFSSNTRDYRDLDRVDLSSVSAQTGIELLKRSRWRERLDLQYEQLSLEGSDYADFASIGWSHTALGKRINWGLNAQWQDRSYKRSEDRGREGDRLTLGASVTTAIGLGFQGRLTLERIQLDAEDEFRAYDLDQLSFAVNRPFDNGSQLYGSWRFSRYDYQADEPGYNSPREDDIHSLSVGFSKAHTQHFYSGLRYNYTTSLSNHDLHDYTRHRVEATLELRF